MLAVGHTERYNPAVAAAMPLVTAPRFIEVHRLSAFPDRSLDIDVVFDLMIHDLDIILALVRSEVASIEAVGVPVLTPKYDIANVRLRFASGCIANITASRISRDRVRKIRFFQPDAYLSVDYASQEVEAWRLVRRETASGHRGRAGSGRARRAAPPRARGLRQGRARSVGAAGGWRRGPAGARAGIARLPAAWRASPGECDRQRLFSSAGGRFGCLQL